MRSRSFQFLSPFEVGKRQHVSMSILDFVFLGKQEVSWEISVFNLRKGTEVAKNEKVESEKMEKL